MTTMFLDKKYRQYTYSQLAEMLPLKDEEIWKISPSMTVKDIRDFKKNKKKPKEKIVSAERSDVGTNIIEQEEIQKKFDYEKYKKLRGKEKRNDYIEEIKSCSDKKGELKILDENGRIYTLHNVRVLDEEKLIMYVPYPINKEYIAGIGKKDKHTDKEKEIKNDENS